MTVYSTSALSASITWPEPIEPIWQALPKYSQSLSGWKRTDLGLCERLFIGAVLNIPKERRPWGIVSWLAETLCISRPSLYSIGEWTKAGLLPRPALPMITAPSPSDEKKTGAVTSNRMKRTALTLLLPGGVSDRSAEICLQAAFDEGRSPASLSALMHEAGERAGEILQRVDHSVMGEVVQARDELFVGRDRILLMVEPHRLVIVCMPLLTGMLRPFDRLRAGCGAASCCLHRRSFVGCRSRVWLKMAAFLTLRLAKPPSWMLPFKKTLRVASAGRCP